MRRQKKVFYLLFCTSKMVNKQPNRSLHRQIMFEIIHAIYTTSLADRLAFKWWTLCMFLYWLDRFSVDLDFDLVSWDIHEVFSLLKNLVAKYGQIIEKTKTKIILRYPNGNYPLKLEINTRIQKHDEYEKVLFFGTPILAMKQSSMFANKLYALYQRKQTRDKVASRDLYDIRFFFKHHWEINEKLLKERSGKSLKTYITFLQTFIPQNFDNTILLGLWELLNEKQKYFVKNKLIAEVLSQIDFFLWNK